jgi:hypothetical protein
MLQFIDRAVPYAVFVKDIAATVARMLRDDSKDPEYISQRMAYRMFGRSNVDRWKAQRKITPYKRPGKVEYFTADLRLLQRTEQDYFKDTD